MKENNKATHIIVEIFKYFISIEMHHIITSIKIKYANIFATMGHKSKILFSLERTKKRVLLMRKFSKAM